jgi:hypothetical protein
MVTSLLSLMSNSQCHVLDFLVHLPVDGSTYLGMLCSTWRPGHYTLLISSLAPNH